MVTGVDKICVDFKLSAGIWEPKKVKRRHRNFRFRFKSLNLSTDEDCQAAIDVPAALKSGGLGSVGLAKFFPCKTCKIPELEPENELVLKSFQCRSGNPDTKPANFKSLNIAKVKRLWVWKFPKCFYKPLKT